MVTTNGRANLSHDRFDLASIGSSNAEISCLLCVLVFKAEPASVEDSSDKVDNKGRQVFAKKKPGNVLAVVSGGVKPYLSSSRSFGACWICWHRSSNPFMLFGISKTLYGLCSLRPQWNSRASP